MRLTTTMKTDNEVKDKLRSMKKYDGECLNDILRRLLRLGVKKRGNNKSVR